MRWRRRDGLARSQKRASVACAHPEPANQRPYVGTAGMGSHCRSLPGTPRAYVYYTVRRPTPPTPRGRQPRAAGAVPTSPRRSTTDHRRLARETHVSPTAQTVTGHACPVPPRRQSPVATAPHPVPPRKAKQLATDQSMATAIEARQQVRPAGASTTEAVPRGGRPMLSITGSARSTSSLPNL